MRKLYSLIDKIYGKNNLEEAFRKVKKNNGAPGIDQQTVKDFANDMYENIERLHDELKTDKYTPLPVLRVEIDKPDGGKRKLGIPSVRDRVVQQAFVNVVEPYFDREFHPSSYGYRRGKSQHQAVAKAADFMRKYGLEHVVDMDLSKCFDTLDHDIIIDSLAKKISDNRVLNLVRKWLKSGIMEDMTLHDTEVGSSQGGVCSPLISNIYLDYFDQKMKSKNIRIVRFADDILIFASTKKEAGDYKYIATNILEKDLKLKVNEKKTHITRLDDGVPFLGFIMRRKYLSIQPSRIKKFKTKVYEITKRNQPTPMMEIIKKLNPVIRGWLNYYKIADIKALVRRLMEWTRRRLRSTRMKQWKTYKKMHKELRKAGIPHNGEKMNVTLWKNSKVYIIQKLLSNGYFRKMKLYDMSAQEVGLLSSGNI
ncbi:group II intron reverse transcriptase/maturase, partial [Acidaminobacter sp. JC074]|uniref:group II intron reverse transcriptase/maturase n=1 Tax=Acidaminobacter sp. JC074 TaxID=2530199 RepID=UPI001F0E8176